MIRPRVLAMLGRYGECLAALAVLAIGIWLIALGGYLLTPLGTLIGALGVAWAVQSIRRVQFSQTIDSPGVVEVDEAQIGYFGPNMGGYVSVSDLTEIRLLSLRGRRVWRLKQSDGQTLLIPIDAHGAENLFDAFAALPGMNTNALVAALDPTGNAGGTSLNLAAETKTVWHRKGNAVLSDG